ncbi:MAG TPA: arsenic resistance protein [Nitrososphaera sp.]
MRPSNDAILAVAITGSMSAGVLVPQAGLLVEPYLLVWLGVLLFFNLIRLKPADLVATFARPRRLAVLAGVKLIVLPLAMYAITLVLYSPLALPILLVAGMSTGLGAPFVANIAGARLPLIVGMIIVTSLSVPFTLPALTYALVGSEFELPIGNMILLLALALFIPLLGGYAVKKKAPRASEFADRNSFLLSIIFVVLINMGMFSRLSPYFFAEQTFLVQNIAASFVCFAVFSLVGFAAAPRGDRASGLIPMAYVNNTLVMVFALQFFGPETAALAGLYNIPYYVCVLPLKRLLVRASPEQRPK